MTRSNLSTLVFAACMLAGSGPTFGQSHQQPSNASIQELDAMSKRYKLDSGQRSEIRSILQSRAEDLTAISEDSGLTPEQRKKKADETRRVCDREIEAVLHEGQRVQFDNESL